MTWLRLIGRRRWERFGRSMCDQSCPSFWSPAMGLFRHRNRAAVYPRQTVTASLTVDPATIEAATSMPIPTITASASVAPSTIDAETSVEPLPPEHR